MKSYSGIRCVDEAISRIPDSTRRRWAAENASLFSKYLQYKDEPSLWSKAKASPDQRVTTYSGKHHSKLLSKSITHFPCSSQYIYKFYSDTANLRHLDPHFQDAKEVEVIEDPIYDVTFSILWITRQNYGSYKSRDAVLSVLRFMVGQVHYLVSHSIEHPDFIKRRTPLRSKVDCTVTEVRSSWNRRDSVVTRLVSEDTKEKIPTLYPGKLVDQSAQDLIRLRKAMSQ